MEWIKLDTSIFDNRKIQFLLTQSGGESACLCYIRLLTLAGQYGTSGRVMLCDGVPYDAQMLATKFGYGDDAAGASYMEAILGLLVKLKLIDYDGEAYSIASWGEHQSVEKLDRERRLNAERQKRFRERKKTQEALRETSRERYATVTSHHEITGDITENNAGDRYGDADVTPQSKSKSKSKSKKETPKGVSKEKPVRHKYGENSNVLLTESELAQLKTRFTDWQDRIDRLSWYMASTGKSYKSHYATILNWARKDKPAASNSGSYNADWGF